MFFEGPVKEKLHPGTVSKSCAEDRSQNSRTSPDKQYSIAHKALTSLQWGGAEEEDLAMLRNDAFAVNVIEFSLLTSFHPDDILQTHVKRTKNNKQTLFWFPRS